MPIWADSKGIDNTILKELIPSLKNLCQQVTPYTLTDWFYWLIDNVPFDQLGLESKGTTKWIHVSCKPDPKENRQSIFRKTM